MNEICEWRCLRARFGTTVDVKSKWRGQRGGAGGTWASDFPDEIQYVRRCILKRHFLMGAPHEYKFPPPPSSELEGQMHLASAHSGEVQRCLSFFFHHNIYFHPITEKNWGDFTPAAYESSIHTSCFVSFILFSVCARVLVCVLWTLAFIISVCLWACRSKLYMAAAKSSRWVCERRKMILLVCSDLEVMWDKLVCVLPALKMWLVRAWRIGFVFFVLFFFWCTGKWGQGKVRVGLETVELRL